MKLVHWPLMGGLLHLVQRGGDWTGPQPLLAVLLYNGPLLCGSNVPVRGLTVSLMLSVLLVHRPLKGLLGWLIFKSFYRSTRMHSGDYAVARCPAVCLSVCLSVTRRYSIWTHAERTLNV